MASVKPIVIHRIIKPEDMSNIVELYLAGKTMKEIALMYQVAPSTIRIKMRETKEGLRAVLSRQYRGTPVYAFDPETKERRFSWKSIPYAAKKLGIASNRIRYAIKNGNKTYGLLFSEEPELCQNK